MIRPRTLHGDIALVNLGLSRGGGCSIIRVMIKKTTKKAKTRRKKAGPGSAPGKKTSKKTRKTTKKTQGGKTHEKGPAKTRARTGRRRKLVDPAAASEASRYENPIASRELILELIGSDGAMNYEDLVAQLGMSGDDELEALRRRLRAMVRDGQLVQNRRGGYIPVDEADLIRGRVIAHPDGFGFLVPEEGGDDLFLSARQMRTLLHGDKAVVQVAGIDRRGRREGAVISVFERANHTIVGRLFIESGVAFVSADNKRITQDILIPADAVNDASQGQIVKVEIVQQPTFKHQPIGRVIEVVGDHMAPGMEIDVAIHSHGLPHVWTDAVLREADALGIEVSAKDKQGRMDLRDLPLVTIDGEDARDFDDAVYCEPKKSGWRLLVAIADVAHYVNMGSALDDGAYERATSVYFPGRVIPMLPEAISNGLCSLNPDVDRLCMVCEMSVTTEGEVKAYQFHEAVMRSHARLTYTKVAQAVVDKDKTMRAELEKILPQLENLYSMYKAFAKARKNRGSIDFDTTETKILFNQDMRIESIKPLMRNDAHKLIEECMISANICAAKYIAEHKLPNLYRVHESPDDDKLEELRGYLQDVGLKLGAPARKISPKDYAKLTSSLLKREDRHLIQTLLLRSMRQAAYRPENSGHFGLALTHYAHFTSPIRRYPDLLIHRGIKHLVRKQKRGEFPYNQQAMVSLGEHCSSNERRADEATRDAEFALKCEYMLDKIGKEFDAHVTGVVSFGLFVELDELYVEGLIHITSLPRDYYEFDPLTHQLTGERRGMTFKLCDAVRVRVSKVDMDERRIDFELVKAD